MIEKKKRWKVQRNIRKWANKNSEKVYDTLGRFCNKCKTTESLSIHHKEYKPGIEFLEILCQRCHRNFHNLETKKRLLICTLDEIELFQEIKTTDSLEKFREWLIRKIDAIPVKVIPDLEIDGFEK